MRGIGKGLVLSLAFFFEKLLSHVVQSLHFFGGYGTVVDADIVDEAVKEMIIPNSINQFLKFCCYYLD